MENSHKRMLTEMEEKHRRELAALQAEKEQALAEETQVICFIRLNIFVHYHLVYHYMSSLHTFVS